MIVSPVKLPLLVMPCDKELAPDAAAGLFLLENITEGRNPEFIQLGYTSNCWGKAGAMGWREVRGGKAQ